MENKADSIIVKFDPFIPPSDDYNRYLLKCPKDIVVESGDTRIIDTKLKVNMPKYLFGQVTKSSAHEFRLGGGVIDSGYRNTIGIIVINTSDKEIKFRQGETIAFLTFCLISKPPLQDLDDEKVRNMIQEETSCSGIQFRCFEKTMKKPSTAYDHDAGYDIFLYEDITIPAFTKVEVRPMIHMQIPDACIGIVYSRSGLSLKKGILASGVHAPSAYRPLMLTLENVTDQDVELSTNTAVAQLVLHIFSLVVINPTTVLDKVIDDSIRGMKGFGSSDKKLNK
jgi:dUTP pyrophosphatase